MRRVCFTLAILFIVAAFARVTEVQPVAWILLYGIMAVTSVLAAFAFYSRKLLIGLIMVVLLYAAHHISSISEKRQGVGMAYFLDVNNKDSHDVLGLLICFVILVLYLFQSYRIRKT